MTAAEARALCPQITLGPDEVEDFQAHGVFSGLGTAGASITTIAYQRLLEHARDHAFCPWRDREHRDYLWIVYRRAAVH